MKKAKKSVKGNYTEPILCDKNAKDWFVFFRYFHAGKWHPRKLREKLNYITDLREKKRQFDVLLEVRTEWLAAGWNPITDPKFKLAGMAKVDDLKEMTFPDALDYAFKKKVPDLADKTVQDYRNFLAHIKTCSLETGHGLLPIRSINRLHVIDLLDYMRTKNNWSNHRYNMYMGCLRSHLTELEKRLVIDYNPATKIDTKVVPESALHESYDMEEKEKISIFLKVRHYPLFVFMQFVYHTGIRPKELLQLKISDINIKTQRIKIIPDMDAENSKTPFLRVMVIPNALMVYIKKMQLEQYSEDFYVFGTPFLPGKGNRGAGTKKWDKETKKTGLSSPVSGRSGAMRLDFLTPSQYAAKRDSVTDLWKRLVKHELGIKRTLYAAKHTGGDDKILAGIPVDALQIQYGHRNKRMTEKYAKKLLELRRGVIMDQAPAFT